ncbi:MAG: hypothetical protein IT338_15920 [Thermomicrobiales bacterium]|nr:hypothetical protein [Thermomicrobiales bacterium]
MASSIKISPTPVMILVDQGEDTGAARVSYRTDEPASFLWERTLGGSWQRRSTGSSSASSGGWPIQLEVGAIYQVLMYAREDADPNVAIDDPVSPVARATTAGLAKRTPAALVTSEETGVGGTYFGWYPRTDNVRTQAVLQVGSAEPRATEEGVDVLPNPLGTVEEEFADSHALLFASELLLPGNDYWATLLLIGEDGTWQSKKMPFTTRKRTVEILLKEIHIINDGSPGENDASFRLWVCEGDTFINACALTEREISDRPSPGEEYKEYIALSADCDIPIRFGPSLVSRNRQRVAVLTRGIARSTFGADDISGNFDPTNGFPTNPPHQEDIQSQAFLYLPVGPAETVEEDDLSTYAEPLNNPGSNEFTYEVTGTYSVTYE